MYLGYRNWRVGISWRGMFWFEWGRIISGGGWIEDAQIWRIGPFYAVRELW